MMKSSSPQNRAGGGRDGPFEEAVAENTAMARPPSPPMASRWSARAATKPHQQFLPTRHQHRGTVEASLPQAGVAQLRKMTLFGR